MNGSDRLLSAFFNWGNKVITNPEEPETLQGENRYVAMLRQFMLCLDHSFFEKTATKEMSLKQIQLGLCQYSRQVLGMFKEPLLKNDSMEKATPLKILMMFKLIFRIANQQGLSMKVEQLNQNDRTILDHYISSLSMIRTKELKKTACVSPQTLGKSTPVSSQILQIPNLDPELLALRKQNQRLKMQLKKSQENEKRARDHNLIFQGQLQLANQQRTLMDIHFYQLKSRVDLLEEYVGQLNTEEAEQTQQVCQSRTLNETSLPRSTNTIYHTPNQNFSDAPQQNHSVSTGTVAAKQKYRRLKDLHIQFQKTVECLIRRD